MPNIGTREDLSVLRFRKGGSTYYFTSGIFGSSTSVYPMSANALYAIPFFIAKTEKYDRIAINVTVAGAAGTRARLGIYADTGVIAPGRLILDAGEVAVDAIAVVEATISKELDSGQLYWLASVSNGVPTLRGPATSSLHHLFFGASSVLGTIWFTFCYIAFTYAALPNPFGTGITLAAGDIPAVFLRKV